MPTFKDHFSHTSLEYSQSRPQYPAMLFEKLASLVKHHELVWDCATGNGQAAVNLAKYFAKVIATDASEQQIHHAKVYKNIEYRIALAENSGLENHSVDLVTVAQALHWFDFEKFYKEVRRVIKPGGVLAAWAYDFLQVDEVQLNQLIQEFYWEIIGSYWPPERKYFNSRYQDIPFPFEEIDMPEIVLHLKWTFERLFQHISTSSAVKYYQQANQENPVRTWLQPRIQKLYPDLRKIMHFHSPLFFRVGRC